MMKTVVQCHSGKTHGEGPREGWRAVLRASLGAEGEAAAPCLDEAPLWCGGVPWETAARLRWLPARNRVECRAERPWRCSPVTQLDLCSPQSSRLHLWPWPLPSALPWPEPSPPLHLLGYNLLPFKIPVNLVSDSQRFGKWNCLNCGSCPILWLQVYSLRCCGTLVLWL